MFSSATLRASLALAVLAGWLALPAASGAASHHRAGGAHTGRATGAESYDCTGETVTLALPQSVTSAQVDAVGAAGSTPSGSLSGEGGGAAEVTANINVALARQLLGPASTLTLYVGCQGGFDGGFGYGHGGDGGRGSEVAKDGNGGGGGTAVVWGASQPTALVVAGGGGGGGGEGVSPVGAGGNGGSAGTPEGTPGAGDGADGKSGGDGSGGAGGPGGYNSEHFGFNGSSADTGSGNGGAGGGGGGWHGGGGGQTGASGQGGGGGGGGGAGTSYADDGQCEQGTQNCVVEDIVYKGVSPDTNDGQGKLTVTYTTASQTSIVSSVSPSVPSQSVHFTATVRPRVGGGSQPTGTVQFSVDGSSLGGPVTLDHGVAVSPATSLSGVGNHPVTADYSGDDTYQPSSASTAQTLIPLMTVASPAPQGQVGHKYSFRPQLGSGTAPYHWSVWHGTLPPGLSLDPSTGAITGVPTQASSSTVVLKVTDSGQPRMRSYPSYAFDVESSRAPAPPSSGTAAGPVHLVLPFGDMTSPDGVAVDQAGNVFVADGTDRTNGRVLELPQGASTPVTMPFSGLNGPSGVAVDQAGDVFVADQGNNRVLELAHGASKPTVLPFGHINQPDALAVDQAGDVYVAQATSNQVLELPQGSTQPVVVGTFQEPPYGLAVDQAGDLFASQGGRGEPASNTVVELRNGASKPNTLPFTGLNSPTGVAVDQAGDVFVSDNENWRVLELPHGASKQVVLPFPSSFGLPMGLAVASNGDVFAADNSNDQVAELPAQLSVTSPAPDASVGAPYQFTPQVTGGAVPLHWGIVRGQLPAGLTLNPSTGAIAGTPTQTGSATVTIQLTDSGQPQLSAYPSYSISVQAGRPAATPQPGSLDFGTQTVFWSYPAKGVTLSNTGFAPLKVSGVGISGTNASEFALTADACSGKTIARGGSCQVEVRFVPGYTTGIGAKSATLRFTDNASDSPQSVPLSGVSQLYVSSGQQPQFSMAPDTLDFPHTAPRSHSPTQHFKVTNTGNEPMSVTDVSLAGKDPHQFTLLTGTCAGASVAPGASCLISVQFRPTALGYKNALVKIDDNAPGSPHIAQVTGTAVG